MIFLNGEKVKFISTGSSNDELNPSSPTVADSTPLAGINVLACLLCLLYERSAHSHIMICVCTCTHKTVMLLSEFENDKILPMLLYTNDETET